MSALSRMQRMAVAVFATVAVVTALLFVLPYFLVSEQKVRAEVARSIFAATGVSPRIEGEVKLTLLPRPAILLSDVQFEDGTTNGLTIESLQATVQFLPLLYGDVKIATLTLSRPRLIVEFSADGKLVGGLPMNSPMKVDDDAPELRIVDGSILLRIQGRERVELFSNVHASLSWSDTGLTTTGTLQFRNQPVNASLAIANTSAFMKGQRSGLRLRVESGLLRFSYEGGLAAGPAGLNGEGSLSADSRSLRNVLALFDIKVPSPRGLERFSAKANVSLTPIALALTNLTFELDGNRADGGITLKRDGERMIVQGALASETADFSRYQATYSLLSASGREWSRELIDTSALQAFDLDLRLSYGKLLIGRIELGKTAATIALRNRQLIISVGEAQFYGGKLRGRATFAATGEVPEVKIESNIASFDLEGGLGGLTGFRRIEGAGTLTLQIAGRGRSINEIARSLNGNANLAMRKGALNGINAELVLRRLERKPLSGTGDLRGGKTPFEKLVADLKIENGVAELAALDIQSDILKINLSGNASIAQRDLDLRGTASLMRPKQANQPAIAFDLPFIIQGDWDNPYLLPDPNALIRHSGAAAPLLDAVRGKATREAMRSLLENVTGLRAIGELPLNPTFGPPMNTATPMEPVSAPGSPPAQ